MGKAQYLLGKAKREEYGDIQKKGKKRGLWGKIGMGLGGLLVMGLTGGAATPLIAGLMSAGGTYAGGKLGDILARQWGGARIKGKGRFFKGEREGIVESLNEQIKAGALKAGLTAGMTQWGAGLKFGKEGLSLSAPGVGAQVTKEGVTKTAGVKVGDIFKSTGTPTAAHTYGEGLMGKLGKAMDIKGSYIGGKVSSRIIGKQLQEIGEGAIGTTESIVEGAGRIKGDTMAESVFAGEGGDITDIISTIDSKVPGRVRTPIATEDIAGRVTAGKSTAIDKMLQERGPLGTAPSIEDIRAGASGPGFQKGVLPGHEKIQYDVAQAKSAEISAGLKDYQFGPDTSGTLTRGHFSADELYDWDVGGDVKMSEVYAGAPQYDEFGSWTGGKHLDPSEVLKLRQQESMEQFLSDPKNRQQYGKALYEEGSVLGDDITRDMMAKYADPRALEYGDQKTSAWDKFKDFVDVSDVVEERDLMSQIKSARNIPMKSIERTGSSFPLDPKMADPDYSQLWGDRALEFDYQPSSSAGFSVPSPDLVGNIGGAYTQSPAYDYKAASAEKAGEISWQKRILGI